MSANRAYRLARRPVGLPAREDFELAEEPVGQPEDGQVDLHGLPGHRVADDRDDLGRRRVNDLGVRTVPTATTLTRIPCGPHSRAMVRLNDSSPAFAAEYAPSSGAPLAATEEMLTMLPA